MIGDVTPLLTWDSEATWRTFEDDSFRTAIGGVELQKCQPDLDRYAELIDISQPDLVVEVGSRAGGSALWFAEQGLQVVSIDIDGRERPERTGIQWITGHSCDMRVYSQVFPWTEGKRVMVSLDGDHHAPQVCREIDLWMPLVSPGCYLVVEDGCFDMWEGERAKKGGWNIPVAGGPLWALHKMRFTLTHWGFWRDTALEDKSSISHSPGGWWRKRDH